MIIKLNNRHKIPFLRGNQLDCERWCLPSDYEFYETIDNFIFEDTLEVSDYSRGQSSVKFIMKRLSNGKTVSVFVSDFTDMCRIMNNGKVTGKFGFVKKGANYGCALMEEQ